MNLHSVFAELDKLYESMEKPVEEPVEEVTEAVSDEVAEETEVTEVLTEAADEEEIVIEEDPVVEEEPEVEEDKAEEVQLVLECSNCGGLKIVAEADAKVDEETDLVNVGDACQYCEEAEGYKIIGSLTPYAAEEAVEEVVDDEVIEGEAVEEGLLDAVLPVSVDIKTANGNSVSIGDAE